MSTSQLHHNEFVAASQADPKWIVEQKEIFAKWFNVVLSKAHSVHRTSGATLLNDLKDSVILLQTVQALYPLVHLPRWFDPCQTEVQRLDNATTLLRSVQLSGIRFEFVTPRNIVDGDEAPVMGLVWLIIKELQVKESLQKAHVLDELITHASTDHHAHPSAVSSVSLVPAETAPSSASAPQSVPQQPSPVVIAPAPTPEPAVAEVSNKPPSENVAFGVERGRCMADACECERYRWTSVVAEGGQCQNCGHFPTQHEKVSSVAEVKAAGPPVVKLPSMPTLGLAGPLKNPGIGPIEVDLKGGTKWICRCGQSAKYPYCDSSHKEYNAKHGTNFEPWKATKEEQGVDSVWVCGCGKSQKRSATGIPLCDSTHETLTQEEKDARLASLAAANVFAGSSSEAGSSGTSVVLAEGSGSGSAWKISLVRWIQRRVSPFGCACESLSEVNGHVLLCIMKSLEPEAVRDFDVHNTKVSVQEMLDVAETRLGIPKLFDGAHHVQEWAWSLYLSAYLVYLPRRYHYLRGAFDKAIHLLEKLDAAHQGVLQKIDDRKLQVEDVVNVMVDRAKTVAKQALDQRREYIARYLSKKLL